MCGKMAIATGGVNLRVGRFLLQDIAAIVAAGKNADDKRRCFG